MPLLAATNKQVPEHSIMDAFNKQVYLGNTYSVAHTFTIGASEAPILLLQNIQTGNPQTLLGIFQNVIRVIENTASQSAILKVYLNPTVTGAGTALTATNIRSSYADNSIATVAYSPSASSNGTLVDSISAAALSVGSSGLLRILDNGQSMLITATASASSTSITAILQWYEI